MEASSSESTNWSPSEVKGDLRFDKEKTSEYEEAPSQPLTSSSGQCCLNSQKSCLVGMNDGRNSGRPPFICKSSSFKIQSDMTMGLLNERRLSDSHLAISHRSPVQMDFNESENLLRFQAISTELGENPGKYRLMSTSPRSKTENFMAESAAVEPELSCAKNVSLFQLAWEDILFIKILPYLRLSDLFALRLVSQDGLRLVQTYFSQLKRLELENWCSYLSRLAFQTMTENCSSLRSLIIPGATWAQDSDLVSIFKANQQLNRVDLSGCSQLKGSCLLALAVNCKKLRILYLRDCSWVTKGAVETLIAHLRHLQELDFSSCVSLTNYQIFSITQAFPRLSRLHVAQIQAVNDSTLLMIGRNCRELAYLDVRACMGVTDNGIRAISDYCPSLTTLRVEGCHLVTEYSLTALRSKGTVTIDRPASEFFLHMPAVLIPRVQV